MTHRWMREALWAIGSSCGMLSVLGLEGAAHADTCISRAIGVPGLSNQPPRWMGTSTPTQPVKTQIDDPRWLGAMRHSFPNAAPQDAELRAVHDGTYLYVSLRVLARSGPPVPGYDAVYLGFAQNATSEAKLVKLTLDTASTPSTGASGQLVAAFFKQNPATSTWTGTPPPGAPWIEDAYLWADSAEEEWTVNVKANLANLGLDPAVPFRSLYSIFVQQSTLPAISTQFIYPSGLPEFSDGELTGVNPVNWTQTTLGTSTSCVDGITLSWNQITTDNTPSNKINNDAPNVFHVNPSWNAVPIAADAIQARMRLAHWGSVADPAAAWTEFAAGIRNAADGNITYRCGGGGEPACPTNPAGEDPHQCVLVELSGTGAQTVHFSRDSSWNNMNFAPASKFEMPAEINLAGVAPLPNGNSKRDIYLYFKIKNMPAQIQDERAKLGLAKGTLLKERQLVREFQHPSRKELRQWIDLERPSEDRVLSHGPAGQIPGTQITPAIAARIKSDRTIYQQLRATRATYEVHVYYDTGATVKGSKGGLSRIVRPMIPFGHFVYHEGPIQGWFHDIQAVKDESGNSFCLEKLGRDWYHASVNQNGKVTVKTTVIALEPGQKPPKVSRPFCCGCRTSDVALESRGLRLTVLGALGLTLLGFARRRKGRAANLKC